MTGPTRRKARQAVTLAIDDAQEVHLELLIFVLIVEQNLRRALDRGQRCAQLMGNRGNELVFQAVKLLQFLVGPFQCFGVLEDFLFQPLLFGDVAHEGVEHVTFP